MDPSTLLLIAQLELSKIDDAHPWLKTNGPTVLVAMAQVESGCRNLAPYQDGKTLARGCFAYHRIRWSEVSDRNDWTTASVERQVAVHLHWMNATVKKAELKKQNYLAYIASSHNGFGTQRQREQYLNKITKALNQLKGKP